jgi:hypothetical protein
VRVESLDDSPSSIAGWFSQKRQTIRPSTFRYYGAAMVYLLTMKQKEGHKQSEEIDFAISAVNQRPTVSSFQHLEIVRDPHTIKSSISTTGKSSC